jgi:gas vesicle protein
MALFTTDWRDELKQAKDAIGEIVDDKLDPLIQGAISQAGGELGNVVKQASSQLQENILVLSKEIHDQRRVTKDDVKELIDYAANKIAKTIDERIAVAKQEVSMLVTDKVAHLRGELEEAAVRSRKTLYFNLSVSVLTALVMAAIGLVYRKITLDELDVFSLFRVLLLSSAVGTGLFSALKMFTSWRGLNKTKKNVAAVAISYLGILRPNGAVGMCVLSLVLLLLWALVTFYPSLGQFHLMR